MTTPAQTIYRVELTDVERSNIIDAMESRISEIEMFIDTDTSACRACRTVIVKLQRTEGEES